MVKKKSSRPQTGVFLAGSKRERARPAGRPLACSPVRPPARAHPRPRARPPRVAPVARRVLSSGPSQTHCGATQRRHLARLRPSLRTKKNRPSSDELNRLHPIRRRSRSAAWAPPPRGRAAVRACGRARDRPDGRAVAGRALRGDVQ